MNQGTVHFRFGVEPGEIDLDNITIIDKETGVKVAGVYDFENDDDFTKHWETWHEVVEGQQIATVNTADGIGVDGSRGLQVRIVNNLSGRFTDFHLFHERCLDFVKGKTYVLTFDARSSSSRSLRIAFYRPAEPAYLCLGQCGKDVLDSQVKLAAESGVNFVSFLSNERIWPDANGKLDFTKLDQVCDVILRANPDALLIPRLELDPDSAWLDANPDEREIWRNAGKDHDAQGWNWPSLYSVKYRQTANQTLAAIIRHLEEKYGDSIAGYHPCGKNTEEWFTPNTWSEGDAGFATIDRLAFLKWLKTKYQNVENLR
ncbi:MAG: beta-galactosidase, partial [Thermoguttaceae bacterium]|nr:beta-galactosidase [Thermoguttaceae bacterium]